MTWFSVNDLLTSNGPLVITDQLVSPGDFLLHQLLSEYVKNSSDGKCVIISTSQDVAKWKSISSRSGFNLTQKLEQGSIIFIDVPTQLPDLSPSEATLLPLLNLIRNSVKNLHRNGTTPTLLIFDELATFEWIGHPVLDISRFARALVAYCAKNDVYLVVRYHIAVPVDLDGVVRILLQLAAYHIEVLPLSSGKSGAVSGEISVHAGPTLISTPRRVIPRSRALQYRLGDYQVTYFQRGMGSAVL